MTRMEWLVIVTVASKENTCIVNLAYFLDYWFKRMLLKKKKKDADRIALWPKKYKEQTQ